MKNKILKLVIIFAFTAIIGITLLVWAAISGLGMIKNSVIPMFSNTNITSTDKGQTNLPEISKGFKTLNSYNVLLASMTTSEDIKSKQKIILINPGIFFNITKQDIESNNIESQLKNMTSIGPVQILNFNNFEIIKKGSFKVAQQNVPYVKGKFGTLSEGIIGVLDTKNSKNTIFISTANSGKFKIKIVEDFFKQIK